MKLPKVETEYLFYAEIKTARWYSLTKDAFQNEILISPTAGGFFEGEKLSGTVECVGAGYTLTRPPNRNDIQIKLLLKTDDGEGIFMSSEGTLLLDPELERRLIAGEPVPAADYYYRFRLTFWYKQQQVQLACRQMLFCNRGYKGFGKRCAMRHTWLNKGNHHVI